MNHVGTISFLPSLLGSSPGLAQLRRKGFYNYSLEGQSYYVRSSGNKIQFLRNMKVQIFNQPKAVYN